MSNIRLPRPLSDYFAFGEDETNGESRRFGWYFPFRRDGEQVERIRWVWRTGGQTDAPPGALEERKGTEAERFVRIIDWWLRESDHVLVADGPLPRMIRRSHLPAQPAEPVTPAAPQPVVDAPHPAPEAAASPEPVPARVAQG